MLPRKAGSGWAPGLFLAIAFITHMTLPFLGWFGIAMAVLMLVLHAAALRCLKAARSSSVDAGESDAC